MSATTAVRARKPRNTAASLIASEFTARQQNSLKKSSKQEVTPPAPAATKTTTLSDGSIWDEVVLPTPAESHPATTASPVILVLIAFVVVTVLVKVSIALILIAAKITKKITQQIAAFWSAQMGEKTIDFRVYQAIFS